MKKIDLTKGKVIKVLISLSIPIMASSFLQFAYNIIDMIWLGYLGSDSVASIGSSSLFVGLGYSINALVVIGTGIKVSHSIGEKNEEKIKGYIASGYVLNLIIGLIYASVLFIFGKQFIGFLKLGNNNVEAEAYKYLAISAPFLFFTFFNTLFIRIFNSYGNNKKALLINIIGIVVNIILDPIFIFGLDLRVGGAALSNLIGAIIVFVLLMYNGRTVLKVSIKENCKLIYIKDIIRLGFPMSLQRVIFTFINIILARIIAQFGSNAIAAQKIGLQIESIVYMVIGGLNGAITAFVGQNFGAEKFDRIDEGYKSALKIGGVYALFITLLFILIPEFLMKMFIRDINTIEIGSGYLRILGVSQIFSVIEMISNGMFNGIGKPKIPSRISIIFTLLRIPLAYVLSSFIGINGVWIAITISSILKGITAYLVYRFKIWRNYKYVRIN